MQTYGLVLILKDKIYKIWSNSTFTYLDGMSSVTYDILTDLTSEKYGTKSGKWRSYSHVHICNKSVLVMKLFHAD